MADSRQPLLLMRHEQTISLEVTDWPRFRRTTRFSFDGRLFPDEETVRDYAHRRFGEGVLRWQGEGRWLYVRRIPGPVWFWSLMARVLNKSYV